jgi:small conductance mechanosensitive channel
MTDLLDYLPPLLSHLKSLLPFSATLLLCLIALTLLNRILTKQAERNSDFRFRKQLILILSFILVFVLLIIAMPIKNELRGQLFSLFGILVSAVIALSSTTIVGNMMAGIMLRSLQGFKAGDFIRSEQHFGRVSAVGLLHVEIQTEDRDIKIIPNLILVAHPITVIHSGGTIISAEVSLGYDVSHKQVETLLIQAAEEAGLADPFVQVLELGNFSINYRIGGMLEDVKQIISSRSKLRAKILSVLHSEQIEIASPTLMNTRAMDKHTQYIPNQDLFELEQEEREQEKFIEDLVFDKAEKAASLERLRGKFESTNLHIDKLKAQLSKTSDETDKLELQNRIERLKVHSLKLKAIIDREESAEADSTSAGS